MGFWDKRGFLAHIYIYIYMRQKSTLVPKSHLCPVPKNPNIYNYLSSKNTYIYALLPPIYSSLTHNAIDISHD